jgi:thiol-disulfide isomerase/thioredoxin
MKLIIFAAFFIVSSLASFSQEVNSKAPDFAAKDIKEDTIKLSDFKNKVVIIDFWASWCVPCKKSMPYLIELYNNNLPDSLIVIGVNVDTDREKIKAFQNSINAEIPFPVIFDKDSKLPPLYNVEGMPTTVVINKEGIIKFKEIGFNSDLKEKLDKTVKELLEK